MWGRCEDREERLRRHNAGDTKATKHGIPWSLIHSEALLLQQARCPLAPQVRAGLA